jgi:serine/threonine protein phosphatase PrpC
VDHSWGYGSDQRLRPENQDSFGLFQQGRVTLAVVCDGMGGHVGGAQASALAVRTLHDAMAKSEDQPLDKALERAGQKANQVIYEAARKNHRLMGMGTTLVAAAVTETHAYVVHVGDSRAYLIRNGEVSQVTRDHTMVNLFVDAELLTPEDAATHPEAHVLSRSLGVERQVDVEIAEAITLQRGDVLFLCSDGVHGVVTDWELANIDWTQPAAGVKHVLGIVEARDGDDNASAVAVVNAPCAEQIPATPPPEPKRFEELVSSGRASAVVHSQAEQDQQDQQDDQGAPNEDSKYVIFENEQPPPPTPSPDQRQMEKARPQKGNRSNRILIAGGALVASIFVCIGVVATSLPGGAGKKATADAVIDQAQMAVSSGEVPQPTNMGNRAEMLFAPELPPDPRRLPHRPTQYTQAPPGGATQWAAVQAARNHNCPKALDVVTKGMFVSIDHATLYASSWFCFNETNQRPLALAEVDHWKDFGFLLPHFEGSQERREQVETDEQRELPLWYRPAVGGIEYRLEAWAGSGADDLMADVLADLLGEPAVADDLSKDLLLEATAAAGLSQIEEPDSAAIQWWARRVYVTARALNGRPGRMLEAHRPEVLPRIRALLDIATTPRELPEEDLADGETEPVPAPEAEAEEEPDTGAETFAQTGLPRAVALAHAVALGAELPMIAKRKQAEQEAESRTTARAQAPSTVVRRTPREPDLGEALPPATVYRGNVPVIRSDPR